MAERSDTNHLATLDTIRDFYAMGVESLRSYPHRRPYTKVQQKSDPNWRSHEQTLCKARVFARLYSKADLQELMSLCQKHNWEIGPSHIIRCLALPKRQRMTLPRQMVAGHWSYSKLEREILIRFGRKTEIGRSWHRFEDVREACCDLLRLCGMWGRLCEAIGRSGGPGRQGIWMQLPPQMRKQVKDIESRMAELDKAIRRKLRDSR